MPEHQQTQQSSESKSTVQNHTTPKFQTPVSNPMAIIQRARINPKSLTHADVLQLQRTIGNRAVGRLLSEIGLIPSRTKQAPPVQMKKVPEEEKKPLQGMFAEPLQRQEIPEEEKPLQGKFEKFEQESCSSCSTLPIQQMKENLTGMPDSLKAGVENLSGIDMSDVRVHYNSSKPAEVGALAYTQGTNIHVAPGQERHLPHEAWHVVQQTQGKVRPTVQLNGVAVNDDQTLEREADIMGIRAIKANENTLQRTNVYDSKEKNYLPRMSTVQRMTVAYTSADMGGGPIAGVFGDQIIVRIEHQRNGSPSHVVKNIVDGYGDAGPHPHEYNHYWSYDYIAIRLRAIFTNNTRNYIYGMGAHILFSLDPSYQIGNEPTTVYEFNIWIDDLFTKICDWPKNIYRGTSDGGQYIDRPVNGPQALRDRLAEVDEIWREVLFPQ